MFCGSRRLITAINRISSWLPSSLLSPNNMNHLSVETEDNFASLLELAANNDVEGFKNLVERDASAIDQVGFWYGRQKGSKQMVLEHRTPLMVAAMYGSIDVLKHILFLSEASVNRSCGLDKTTALHCAASSGSVNAVQVVKLLLSAGADQSLIDANGQRPMDTIIVSPKFQDLKYTLEDLLSTTTTPQRLSTATSGSNSPPLSPSPENHSPSSDSNSTSSPKNKFNDLPMSPFEKKEYPVDPSLPDIKNSIYSTDEFRMFSFKVRPCSRAYSHDWTECPFVHPGENARRRDPRKYHYSCVPCPDFRKGACRRGDMCEYAHGVFECWLHPAQYRTRLCKDGTSCNRRVCFFAHTQDELRPLYVSTGSAVPSPRSSSSALSPLDFAAAMSLLPGSPSSFTGPISPSANAMGWTAPNVPTLHLPQSSRLRSSFNARDIPAQDYDVHPHQLGQPSSISTSSLNHCGRPKTLNPTNLDNIFSSENLSPRYILSQFQQPQSILSPISTSFSPKNIEHQRLQSIPSMSPCNNVDPISPLSSRGLAFAQQHQFRSLSSRDLGSNSGPTIDSWTQWGSNNGKADWAVNDDDYGKIRRSSSFELGNNGEEPDFSWIQSLVKESPHETNEINLDMRESIAAGEAGAGSSSSNSKEIEQDDQSALVGTWIEQLQLDQLVAQ